MWLRFFGRLALPQGSGRSQFALRAHFFDFCSVSLTFFLLRLDAAQFL